MGKEGYALPLVVLDVDALLGDVRAGRALFLVVDVQVLHGGLGGGGEGRW